MAEALKVQRQNKLLKRHTALGCRGRVDHSCLVYLRPPSNIHIQREADHPPSYPPVSFLPSQAPSSRRACLFTTPSWATLHSQTLRTIAYPPSHVYVSLIPVSVYLILMFNSVLKPSMGSTTVRGNCQLAQNKIRYVRPNLL